MGAFKLHVPNLFQSIFSKLSKDPCILCIRSSVLDVDLEIDYCTRYIKVTHLDKKWMELSGSVP